MEIDLSHLQDHQKTILWAGLALVITMTVALLGRHYTPGERLLTWQEWQIQKAEQLRQSELELLKDQTSRLAEVLASDNPEPVRAALIAKAVMDKSAAIKSPTLETARQAVMDAAQAVADWGAGMLEYNMAVDTVMNAIQLLEGGSG